MTVTYITAIISPAEGKEQRIKELISAIVKSAPKDEPGCQRYVVTKALDSNDIILHERYESMDVFNFHCEQSNFKTFAKAVEEEKLTSKPPRITASEMFDGFESK